MKSEILRSPMLSAAESSYPIFKADGTVGAIADNPNQINEPPELLRAKEDRAID
ncbi:MAG: hypothetical protein ACJLTB_02345 [Algoriphagus aquaeductus]|nr:hypothetical protein [Algoriphagus aquaeductus]